MMRSKREKSKETTGRVTQRIVLFTLIALIIPMLIFPRQFGTELARPSLVNALYELVYYGFIMFLFNRRINLVQLIQGAGICLVFRLALGASFGLLIAVMYAMKVTVSLQLGLSSYLPAILFHIAVTPFVLRQAVREEPVEEPEPVPAPPPVPKETPGASMTAETHSISVSRERGIVTNAPLPSSTPASSSRQSESVSSRSKSASSSPTEVNGFERATRYIGEHGSVHLAAVVDHEGLLLANFRRGNIEADDWAPLALLFLESNQQVLDRASAFGNAEKVDLLMKSNRIVVTRENWYSLLVISERQTDDFLNIRINQGMDIIRKYVEERYGRQEHTKAENTYVSGTK
jgi:hypothetical protein